MDRLEHDIPTVTKRIEAKNFIGNMKKLEESNGLFMKDNKRFVSPRSPNN